ncbi:MAG: hypothetical protein HY262_04780, partial [Chloroflexi bacterium]|nr:hypothetical protein [Chloroflexota bacterium]
MGATGLSADPKVYRARLADQEDVQLDAWAAELMRDVAKRRGVVRVVRDFRTAARLHPWDLDPDSLAAIARCLGKARRDGTPEGFRTLRVALLSTFNAQGLVAPLVAGAARLSLDLDIHESDFDMLRAEIADPTSALYAHDPEVVVLAASARDVLRAATVAEQAADWESLWRTVLARTSAHVLQHSFPRLPTASVGHLDVRDPSSPGRLAQALNAELAARAPSRVSIVDVERAQLRAGLDRWTDPRQWCWAKEEVSREAAPLLVEEYLAVLCALTGRTRKVLVLDLDDTLWGGIVGEDG